MQRNKICGVILLGVLLLSTRELWARGGGRIGGGGARLGGASLGGGGAAFAPSMSRPTGGYPSAYRPPTSSINRPPVTRPSTIPSPGSRPATPALSNNRPNPSQNLPKTASNRPGTNLPGSITSSPPTTGRGTSPLSSQNRPSANDLQSFLGLSGNTRPAAPANLPTLSDRRNVGNTIPVNPSNTPALDRTENFQAIRNKWAQAETRPFDRTWWTQRPVDPGYSRWHQAWHRYEGHWCWYPASWVALGTWFPWTWAQPVVYDYGNNVVYTDNAVYMNQQRVASTDEYYAAAKALAESIPQNVDPDTLEWLPLGVFTLAEGEGIDSGMMLQLAVSKQGILAGTFFNETQNVRRPVEGMVDRNTQRVAWKFADGNQPELVMETGIQNLTQDASKAILHFDANHRQTRWLIRLPAPAESKP